MVDPGEGMGEAPAPGTIAPIRREPGSGRVSSWCATDQYASELMTSLRFLVPRAR